VRIDEDEGRERESGEQERSRDGRHVPRSSSKRATLLPLSR
jgi:hypothetical protein